MIMHADRENCLTESSLTIRTEEMHQYHIEALAGQGDIGANMYGVAKRCPFYLIPFFQVTTTFPLDIMHDILEGAMPLLLTLMLTDFHREKIISISQVNDELKAFPFGKNDIKSKPVLQPLTLPSGTSNILGIAIEKWCLFRILPYVIGHYIPTDDERWKLYLVLREIAEYLFAPSISKEILPYLNWLIEQFLQTFTALYPGKMTPKLHYMTHYSRLISQFGPLRYLWGMRFESKHLYFKKLASVVRNFRNIEYTLAFRHQLKQCWELCSCDYLRDSRATTGNRSFSFSVLSDCLRTKIRTFFKESLVFGEEIIFKCSTFVSNSIEFKINDVCILCLLEAEKIPLFFKILHIFNLRSSWILCGKLLLPETFVSHLHVFAVSEDTEITVVAPAEVYDHQLLDLYKLQDEKCYVGLKYHCF